MATGPAFIMSHSHSGRSDQIGIKTFFSHIFKCNLCQVVFNDMIFRILCPQFVPQISYLLYSQNLCNL